uniref:Mediator of RNA polymerase II transcription subunit 33A n=1 Tax=Kalanchoe fedtschenkoi TaxID=63787 RepID=A0A7N0UBA8_KALFE
MAASERGSGGGGIWDKVLLLIGAAQEKETDPLLWALQLSSCLKAAEVGLPSVEVAEILVDYICGDNNVPIIWKFLEKAMVFNIVPPLLVLALLSTRVISKRDARPSAYRLYMELLKRHAFDLKSQINAPSYVKVMKSIDSVLHLNQIFGLNTSEPGVLVVEYIFSILWQLLDASLEDEGLMELFPEKGSRWTSKSNDLEIHCFDDKKIFRERLKSLNTTMAIEMIVQFLEDKVTSKILYLARLNLPKHWAEFVGALELLGNSLALRNSKVMTSESLLQLISDDRVVFSRKRKTSSPRIFHAVMPFGSISSSGGLYHKESLSGFWLPLDLVLEDAMDGYQVSPTSSVEMIKGLIKDLQAINGINWHDTFLGLWMSALRLVQRERDPIEGPVPHLDARLCVLLCITTLVAADLIEEEENASFAELNCSPNSQWKGQQVSGKLRKHLVSSLKMLGDYQGLLIPPQSIVSAANQAAAKAMMSVSGISLDSGYLECINMKDMPINCSGNLRHLIVEACIARNLLDTTAYFWPGYVNGQINQVPHTTPSQVPSWSSFTKGTPLTPPIVKALVSTPASSLADLEKVYEIAIKGTDNERISAATILCGASLVRGWNIQEHTAGFITRLLTPPVPENYSGSESHLIGYAPMLNVLIIGIGSVDCVQIFALLGLVPELAASLMPICEVFGSCVPNVSWSLPSGEEISAHAVFSNAFALLLKLWRFNHPPLEYSVGDVPPAGSHLTPEYLLLLRNSNLISSRAKTVRGESGDSIASTSSSAQPVFLDSFPKLRAWYRQHLACIASTLSGLVHGTPVHQIVDTLLNMMFRKIGRGQPVVSVTSGSSSSSGTTVEDASLRPKLPAWDILEAVPFVVDASLTACANGRLSPRELATGLKDLADFLPACLATIISYFSAEVTRGLWKPVFMNGTDWPSPAANLANVEEKITKILAATGVDVPTISTVILIFWFIVCFKPPPSKNNQEASFLRLRLESCITRFVVAMDYCSLQRQNQAFDCIFSSLRAAIFCPKKFMWLLLLYICNPVKLNMD